MIDGPPRYKAECQSRHCRWRSREYTRLSSAEQAARGHVESDSHPAHVVDHYGLHVAGTTVRPGDPDLA